MALMILGYRCSQRLGRNHHWQQGHGVRRDGLQAPPPSLMTTLSSPPRVKFDTPCFHPNVDVYGNICLDILQDKWSSAYDVRTILRSIQSLLGEPNNDSTLNSQAATLWINQGEFRKVVEKFNKPAAA